MNTSDVFGKLQVYGGKNVGFLYVVRNAFWPKHVYKFGRTSKNLQDRLSVYNSSCPGKVKVLALFIVTDTVAVERHIKQALFGYRYPMTEEFVQMDYFELIKIIESLLVLDTQLKVDLPVYKLFPHICQQTCARLHTKNGLKRDIDPLKDEKCVLDYWSDLLNLGPNMNPDGEVPIFTRNHKISTVAASRINDNNNKDQIVAETEPQYTLDQTTSVITEQDGLVFVQHYSPPIDRPMIQLLKDDIPSHVPMTTSIIVHNNDHSTVQKRDEDETSSMSTASTTCNSNGGKRAKTTSDYDRIERNNASMQQWMDRNFTTGSISNTDSSEEQQQQQIQVNHHRVSVLSIPPVRRTMIKNVT